MPSRTLMSRWGLLLRLAMALLVVRVTVAIVVGYVDYFPPDFTARFLQGRRAYFFGSYQWAFYAHITSGPLTLLLGMALMSARLRSRFPAWHRGLGRWQAGLILVVLVPSGLWMALHAHAGVLAQAGFGMLAVATGFSTAAGWRCAVQRRFAEHQLWMQRGYLLLCSAVVTRLLGGLFVVTGCDGEWTYTFTAWASWVFPLMTNEIIQRGAWKNGSSRGM